MMFRNSLLLVALSSLVLSSTAFAPSKGRFFRLHCSGYYVIVQMAKNLCVGHRKMFRADEELILTSLIIGNWYTL